MSSFIFRGQTAVVPFPADFPLVCTACERTIKESTFKRDIFRHSRNCRQREPGAAEANEVVFECVTCKFITSDRRKATTHQGSHFGDPSVRVQTYPCTSCNHSYGTQKALSSHMRQCKVRKREEGQQPRTPPSPSPQPAPPFPPAPLSPPPPLEPLGDDDPPAPVIEVVADEDDGNLSNVSSIPLPEDLQDMELPVESYDNYEVHIDDLKWQGEECNEWINRLLPPKMKKQRNNNNNNNQSYATQSPKMSAMDLQKLYSKDMKSALQKIQFIPEINCEVDPIDLRFGLLQQLSAAECQPNTPTSFWQPCNKGRDQLARRFTEFEVEQALSHKSSAPGPDGWRYDEIKKDKDFAKKFVEGLHAMATMSITPDSWKSYNSLLLFKKPDEYKRGQEKELRCFRPIALSNVSYKVLTSILCKRLSKWLEMNKGVGFTQRAAFGRNGVSENTLLVGDALRKKKTVVYLDLSDAFNSVEHCLIFEALKQCNCPQWIIELIKSLYRGCKTTPINVKGEVLAGPVPVSKGVKQGCPVSGMLFNLVLDPVLKKATTGSSICLGYMDDLAIVFEDECNVNEVFDETIKTAQALGLNFNTKKCGVANYNGRLEIDGAAIPTVTNDRAYKYLGTEAFPSTITGLDSCFEKTMRVAELIEYSELTPMQKIHALRVKVYPMLFHLLENSNCTASSLEKMNRTMRKMAKRLLFLPERASNAYLHLHRMYGGPGLPDLLLVKSKMTMKNLARSLNTEEEFGDYLKKLLLDDKSIADVLNSINNGTTKGFSDTVKEASRGLHRLRKYLGVELQFTMLEENITLSIDGTTYKDPWPTLNRLLQKQSLKELQKAPNQGRYWRSLAETPITTKAVFNFHTKLCDFRFIHRARLNLVPVRAINVWNPPENQNCRRCQADRETLNHTLNNCSVMRKEIIKRHNDIRDLLASSVPQRIRVLKEQRFGNMQPDLILQNDYTKEAAILDVKVSAEAVESFQRNLEQMNLKYDNLRRAYEISGFSTSINVIQLGALGSFSRSSFAVLRKFINTRREITNFIRRASNLVVHHSRNISTQHLTGIPQNY